jgi:hypothetical protein
VRPLPPSFPRRRRFLAAGVLCLAGTAAGVAAIAARGGGVACIPATLPPENGQRAIAEVLAPGGGKVYARTTGSRLFVGSGDPVRWRAAHAYAPGRLLEAGPERGRDVLYAGNGALYRSGNGGTSWQRLGCGHVLDGLAVAPRRPAQLYLAADVPDGPPRGVGGGLFRSLDGGRTWSRLGIPYPSVTAQAIAVAPRDANDLTVALGAGGVARSRDGGRSWSSSSMGLSSSSLAGPQVWSLAHGPAPGYTLWAGSQQGVYRRGSDGRWTRVLRSGYAADVTVVPDARLPRLAFAFGLPRQHELVARRTRDGGKTWRVVPGLPAGIEGITIRPADDSVFAWTSHAIYRSFDHGSTWTRLPPLPH